MTAMIAQFQYPEISRDLANKPPGVASILEEGGAHGHGNGFSMDELLA